MFLLPGLLRSFLINGKRPSPFANDLNVFQDFDRVISNDEILSISQGCRQDVHNWGRANLVMFDSSKGHLIVILPLHARGACFKLLDLMIDCKIGNESRD